MVAEQKRIDEEQKAKEAREALVTFKEVSDKFIEWAKVNKITWEKDMQRLRDHVLPLIGAKPIIQVVPADIEAIKVKCLVDMKLAPATAVRSLSVVRSIFNFAIKHGYQATGINPVKAVKFPKQNNQRLRFLSHQEADTLLKTAAAYNIELHDMCLLSLYSGMRAGEIFKLTWTDIDLDHGLIAIRDTKNGESRKAFVTDIIREMLIRRQNTRREDQVYIFPDQKGQVRKMISCQFRHLVDKLGLNTGIEDRRQKLCFHSLRHTFASWLGNSKQITSQPKQNCAGSGHCTWEGLDDVRGMLRSFRKPFWRRIRPYHRPCP